MFKNLITACIMLSAFVSKGHNEITGTVRDANTLHVLPGATIQLKETNYVSVTDALGQFRLRVPDGDYELVCSFLGYAQTNATVSIPGTSFLELKLSPTSILTEAVVVNATRANEKSATTFSTLSKNKIEEQNFGQDLPFLLNWMPSVVTTSDAGTGIGYTGIRIRGSDATRINVTINGIPYNDAESQNTFWVDIPDIASSTQSIQVQRGVGTSTNGAAAFGASINLQTNTKTEEQYAEVINAIGSFNTRRHTLQFGTGMIGNWTFDGRVSRIFSDGFIDRASSDLQSYYFSGGYHTAKTILKAVVFGGKERTYQAWYGVPESRLKNDEEKMLETAANEGWNELEIKNLLESNSRTFNPYLYEDQVDDYTQNHYQLHFSQQFADHIILNAALHLTPGKGYYEQFRFDDDFEDYGLSPVIIGAETIESSDIVRRKWLDNKFYGLTFSLSFDRPEYNMIIGGAANRYDGDHFGKLVWATVSPATAGHQYYFNTGVKDDLNLYFKFSRNITQKLSGYIDLQYRNIDYRINGVESELEDLKIYEGYHFFNPKIGLHFSLNEKNEFYSSFSRTNREPVRTDFVDNNGNSPKPERLDDIEIGWKNRSAKHQLHLTYYYMNYKDQLVLTGMLNDVGASLRTNVDRSHRAGIELDGTIKISKTLQWNANLTISENKIKQYTEILYDYGPDFEDFSEVATNYTNTDISFSPAVITGSGFSYFPHPRAEITLLSKYVGKQYLDNTMNETRTIDPYFVNDLRLGYSWRPKFVKEIKLSFLVNNILSEEYESNGYTWGYLAGSYTARENYYFPQAGRNFMAMVAIKI